MGDGPLLTPRDLRPTRPGFEVLAVLNPAAALVDDEVVLLVRVAERPRGDIDPPADAHTLDLSCAEPRVIPLPRGFRKDEVVPIAFEDPASGPLRYLPIYLRKDLPGLDLSDPRGVTFVHPKLQRTFTFLTQISHLRCARSSDGRHFTFDDEPALSPTGELEEYGCEDARATLIDGIWHVAYTSVSRFGVTPALALTRDFRLFERRGLILGPDNKDIAFFPFLHDGQYTALTRPMPNVFGHVLGIWIAYPDRQRPWGGRKPLVLPRRGYWDERHTGAGTVPIRSRAGWVEIYHGVDANLRYALGAVLLDVDDPTVVLARSSEPILQPERNYERAGLMSDVVYACGHVPLADEGERIRVYYGAADSVTAAVDFDLQDIVDSLDGSDRAPR